MNAALSPASVLFFAWLLDALLGEPPASLHPVVWMGNAIAPLKRMTPRAHARELWIGGAYALGIVTAFGLGSWALLRALSAFPIALFCAEVYLLWSCFALKGLLAAGKVMLSAVVESDLSAAREALRSLCSRDPVQLQQHELIGASIESVTENASDSVVAPLFYFALLGVPGAVAYRAANTLDAMVGYRGRFEYLGKVAARLDDVLNLIPARLTTLCLWLSGGLMGLSGAQGLRVWWRDSRLTASPNAGQVMAMAAGLLGVRLDKREAYVLGAGLSEPDTFALARALRLVLIASWLFALTLIAALTLWELERGYAG